MNKTDYLEKAGVFLLRFPTKRQYKSQGRRRYAKFVLSINGIPTLFKTFSVGHREYLNTLTPGAIVFVRYWETDRVTSDGYKINVLWRIGYSTQDLNTKTKTITS